MSGHPPREHLGGIASMPRPSAAPARRAAAILRDLSAHCDQERDPLTSGDARASYCWSWSAPQWSSIRARPSSWRYAEGALDVIEVLVASVSLDRARIIRDALSGTPLIRSLSFAMGADALAPMFALAAVQVVIADELMMDAIGGGWSRLCASSSSALMVVHSSGASVDEIVSFFERGARAALPVDSSGHALHGAVLAVADGGIVVVQDSSRPPVQQSALACLTQREREVLEGVVSAWSNSEIAHEFSISTETVKSHVSSLLRKLGCRNRIELIAKAYQAGLAP